MLEVSLVLSVVVKMIALFCIVLMTFKEIKAFIHLPSQKWYMAEMYIETTQKYSIVIEASRGRHWASDVAIDDLSAVAGFCPSTKKEAEECKVSCVRKDGESFHLNQNVLDGERCGGMRSSDICLDGTCTLFGCDNKFQSPLQVDDCGICGGNSSHCTEVTGHKELPATRTYQKLLVLEQGSTFVTIRQVYAEYSYYFALQTQDNDEPTRVPADGVEIAGSVFYLQTVRGNLHLFSNGPLTEQVQVLVHAGKHEPLKSLYMSFQYFKPVTMRFTYTYKVKGWGECSRSCGTGKQQSIVSCSRIQDNMDVDDSLCQNLEKPLYIRACRLDPCPLMYKWVVEEWGDCSASCDGGYRIRRVTCQSIETGDVVDNDLCPRKLPNHKEICNMNPCPKWHTSDWGICSRTCGSGFQTRVVKCIDQGTGNPVDDQKCRRDEKPDHRLPCNVEECERYYYVVQGVGNCTKTCGGGYMPQIINCIKNSTGQPVRSFYCTGPSPPRVIRCNIFECPPQYEWKIKKQTTCTRTCGNGFIIRYVTCMHKVTKAEAHPSKCDIEDRPPKKVHCFIKKCDEYSYKIEGWTQCSQTCGKGYQQQLVRCIRTRDNVAVNERRCTSLTKPKPRVAPCFRKKCIEYKIQYSEWGPCYTPCGTQRRTSICIEKYSRHVVPMRHCASLIGGADSLKLTRQCSGNCVKDVDTLTCNFDKRNTCGWKNAQNDEFDWSIGRRTPSFFTGPDYDHTSRKGYFAYIEASAPRKEGHRAKLTSDMTYIPKGCFSFWYHMKGVDTGNLYVRLSSLEGSEIIFERNGPEKVQKWHEARMYNDKPGNYRITIEGVRGVGVYSDIAVDDISFSKRPCVAKKKTTKSCNEISPFCKHKSVRQYCKVSAPYRKLCCRTCQKYL